MDGVLYPDRPCAGIRAALFPLTGRHASGVSRKAIQSCCAHDSRLHVCHVRPAHAHRHQPLRRRPGVRGILRDQCLRLHRNYFRRNRYLHRSRRIEGGCCDRDDSDGHSAAWRGCCNPVGTLHTLPDVGVDSWGSFMAATKDHQMSMLHASNEKGFAWYSFLLGYPILGLWYWCTDQTIVQRTLGAKTELDAQQGALFAGLLKILPVFLMVLPGVLAYVLFQDKIGEQAARTLPGLIGELVPTGLRGFISAALLAALMSTIAAALNSAGTLMALDIAKTYRPNITDKGQVLVGRITVVVVMLLAMLWSTQGGRFGSIFEALNKMPHSSLRRPSPPYCFGVFSGRRGTSQTGVWTLGLGFGGGLMVFLIDLGLEPLGGKQWVTEGLNIPFLLQAWWLFCILSVFYFVVSLLTPPPTPEQLEGITWEHPLQVLKSWPGQGPR